VSGMFASQVAVITGASSGIGRALALVLAEEGAKVGVVARRRDMLDSLLTEIRAKGGTVEAVVADVADRAQTLDAFATLAGKLGVVDLLIANAGVGKPTRLDPVNSAEIEQMFRVNVLGVVHCVEAVLPKMLERGRGHLAAVSSLAAYKGLPGESAYSATKAAVNSYMEGLRIQLRSRGITVTTICPGFVRTEMTAPNRFRMPFLMDADVAARKIVRALRRRVGVYNFPWPMTMLMKLAGWLPDWFVARQMQSYQRVP